MLQRGFRFEFETPDDWEPSRNGGRFLYHGPAGEELIVSGEILEGTGPAKIVTSMHDALLENAMAAVSRSAAHPDLVTIKALREDEGAVASPLRCWTVHSQTKAGDTQFSQALISSGMGILLVTFEAPNVPEALSVYRGLLKTIRSAQAD